MSQRLKQLLMILSFSVQESMVGKGQYLVSGKSWVHGYVIAGWINLVYSDQKADQAGGFPAKSLTILNQSWVLLQHEEGIGYCHSKSKHFREIAENSTRKSAEHSSRCVMTLTGFGKNLMML